jgi:NAD(P) transhydrogenase subunit beta
VIIVPGYGMALAQAQHQVKMLANTFESKGAQVRYAIHPVAGRMPGHMNVLLAEADVSYEQLYEMDAINDDFKNTDLVVVIGANDVLNPAAREAEGTPIYGMPILNVDQAQNVIICNYDLNPGYAGVDNPLYKKSGVTMMLGDAKDSLAKLLEQLSSTDKKAVSTESDLGKQLRSAKSVIIVPGYGMALAQAQHQVKMLANTFESKGAQVRYAIHPVAGRMPGHMNVLLAEADVSYEQLYEMDAINDDFKNTDLVVVIGANDVLNPAAREAEGTPIYGMPILNVDQAQNVIICNFDLNPGYAGVDNPLYKKSGVTMMLGDAKDSLAKLLEELSASASGEEKATESNLGEQLRSAKSVIIVPGYGMALAQAQHQVKMLATKFESKGAEVRYAIHPVAGRMPGHMNVLLAEADVSYEQLYEMDAINDDFKNTDLVVVIGANDVLNPAAREAEGTPIYGMPILNVDQAQNVIICNYDLNPGYAGVDNPLYQKSGVTMMLGDAKDSLAKLLEEL